MQQRCLWNDIIAYMSLGRVCHLGTRVNPRVKRPILSRTPLIMRLMKAKRCREMNVFSYKNDLYCKTSHYIYICVCIFISNGCNSGEFLRLDTTVKILYLGSFKERRSGPSYHPTRRIIACCIKMIDIIKYHVYLHTYVCIFKAVK